MQTSESLIHRATRNGWISSLSFFYYIKCQYVNSTVHNYSSRSLAKKVSRSHASVANHIRILKKQRLVVCVGNNLLFKSTGENHKCTLLIKKHYTLKQIEKVLYLKLAEQNFTQQEYVIKKKKEARLIVEMANKPRFKLNRKQIKLLGSESFKKLLGNSILDKIILTDKGLAKLLNISVRKASKIKMWWRDLGLVKFHSEFIRLFKSSVNLSGYIPKDCFFHKGFVCKSTPTEYTSTINYSMTIKM